MMTTDIKFPKYLPYKGERTYEVIGYIGEVDSYIDNKAYVDKTSGKIYIASFEKPVHSDVPILYIKSDGSYVLKEIYSPQANKAFNVANLYDLSLDMITSTTTGDEVLYNEDALQDMNAATTIFCPVINETDDPLKRLIKQVIIDKKIDINRLKHKMPQKYGLTNMKSALIGPTKMSITSFNIWCELLGIHYEIVINDSGADTQNPLDNVLHYSSVTNKVSKFSNITIEKF